MSERAYRRKLYGRPPSCSLSPQQRQVVGLLAGGRPIGDIARQLGISPSTVKSHLAIARRKTGAASSFELAARAAAGEVDL